MKFFIKYNGNTENLKMASLSSGLSCIIFRIKVTRYDSYSQQGNITAAKIRSVLDGFQSLHILVCIF